MPNFPPDVERVFADIRNLRSGGSFRSESGGETTIVPFKEDGEPGWNVLCPSGHAKHVSVRAYADARQIGKTAELFLLCAACAAGEPPLPVASSGYGSVDRELRKRIVEKRSAPATVDPLPAKGVRRGIKLE